MLFSKRRVTNSIAFIVTLWSSRPRRALVLGASAATAAGGGSQRAVGDRVVGLRRCSACCCSCIGVKNWRNRHDTSEPAGVREDRHDGPGRRGLPGLRRHVHEPEEPAAAAQRRSATIASTDAPWLAGAGFVLVGTLPYTGAMLYALLGGERSAATLERLRDWLVARNRLIMARAVLAARDPAAGQGYLGADVTRPVASARRGRGHPLRVTAVARDSRRAGAALAWRHPAPTHAGSSHVRHRRIQRRQRRRTALDIEVNEGWVNMKRFAEMANERHGNGYRMAHVFMQEGNTIVVWEKTG